MIPAKTPAIRASRVSKAGPAAVTRIARLDRLLAEGRPVNLLGLAEKWEISHRTLKRDIERLRDQHGAPIA